MFKLFVEILAEDCGVNEHVLKSFIQHCNLRDRQAVLFFAGPNTIKNILERYPVKFQEKNRVAQGHVSGWAPQYILPTR
jgi:hypothetical protein